MSPLPEASPGSHPRSTSAIAESHEFSPHERSLLLGQAHDAIASVFEHRTLATEPPSPHLAEQRGVFTTIYCAGALRGCVGYALPTTPLFRAVAETARAAAFEDMRFPPLRPDELPQLEVSVSVLSPLRPVRPEEVEIGCHGLLISLHGHRGLLLPQVAVEHGWDRVTFLQQTCRKAGLPLDAWQSGAEIQSFTAEVFGDAGRK